MSFVVCSICCHILISLYYQNSVLQQVKLYIIWIYLLLVQHYFSKFWLPFIAFVFHHSFEFAVSFALKLQGNPLNIKWITIFWIVFEVCVEVNKIIVINSFNSFAQFSISRLKSIHSIFSEIFKISHQSFTLIVDKVIKGCW